MAGTRSRLGGRFFSIVEAGGDRLEELGILAALGLLKAWNYYSDRRNKRRAGRRASDADYVKCTRAIAQLETMIRELTGAVARLTARVKTLERRGDPRERP